MEPTWIWRLINEITCPSSTPILICVDNQSPIKLAKNPLFHHLYRKKVEAGNILVGFISIAQQTTNMVTQVAARKFKMGRSP